MTGRQTDEQTVCSSTSLHMHGVASLTRGKMFSLQQAILMMCKVPAISAFNFFTVINVSKRVLDCVNLAKIFPLFGFLTLSESVYELFCVVVSSYAFSYACFFGSRPSDHYFRSVCLFVCLFVQSFCQPSLIRFRSN